MQYEALSTGAVRNALAGAGHAEFCDSRMHDTVVFNTHLLWAAHRECVALGLLLPTLVLAILAVLAVVRIAVHVAILLE